MGDEGREGVIVFRGGTNYWAAYSHSVLPSYIRGIARKRWALKGESKGGEPSFDVPKTKYCRQSAGLYCNNEHTVPEEAVYVFATDVLGMVPNVVERIVEKIVIVEKGYVTTIEKYEVLQFALTRELRLTQHALRDAYEGSDVDQSLAMAARERTVREVMADLGVDEVEGPSPTWYMPVFPVEEERDETPQLELELA